MEVISMDKTELFKCAAEPIAIQSGASPLVFGQAVFKSDGSAIIICEPINGQTRIFDVKPETVHRYTGFRRKDGLVYEGDVYKNKNGDELTVIWSEDTASWMCLYTDTPKPDSVLRGTKIALYVMPDEFEKQPYVPITDTGYME